MKIIVLDKKTLGSDIDVEKGLSAIGNLEVFEQTSPADTIKRLIDSDVAITNKVVIDSEVMDACPRLKLICITATGTNNVDLKYAEEKGVTVKNVSGYSTNSVVQHTFSLLLDMMNHVKYYDNYVKNLSYSEGSLFTHVGPSIEELNGKTLGIIGLGNIGRRVAEIGSVFGMSVIYHSTSGNNLEQDYPHVDLYDLMERSDVISIHAPLNENTSNLISKRELSSCKPSAILMNMGRGGIVNEKDLAEALLDDKLRGACVDVYEQEPLMSDNPLLNENLESKIVFSPHIAWASKQARETLWKLTVDNVKSYVGKAPSLV